MISVIIPVYNAEPYLNRCIDSVLASAYSDFEIILVNDGSTDRSPDICRAYAENDIRVVFLSQENRGVSSARTQARFSSCPGFTPCRMKINCSLS